MIRLVYLALASWASLFVAVLNEEAREAAPTSTTTTTVPTWVGDPLTISDLSADRHHSEEFVPQVPDLPAGLTYDPISTPSTLPVAETTTTTTTTLPEGKCSEWYPQALAAGWEVDQLTKVGRIAWAESRCQHGIANETYSYGLMQVEWSAHKGWLESEFGITDREALYDPVINFEVSKWLFDYAEEHYGCGWQPWYMSGDWC